jgi:hypothetical protein
MYILLILKKNYSKNNEFQFLILFLVFNYTFFTFNKIKHYDFLLVVIIKFIIN